MNIRDQFEQFKNECEKYVGSDVMNYVVINLSGDKMQHEMFEKLVTIFKYELHVDMYITDISLEEMKLRRDTLSIMERSMQYFKIK